MKGRITLFSFVAASTLAFHSCNKMGHDHGTPVTTNETVNATIAVNANYTYTLPKIGSEIESAITVQAQHASASTVTTDVNGNTVYQYTPVAGYTGTDAVVVTTTGEEDHGGCHHGNQGHHHDNDADDKTTVTTINLTITPAPVATAKTAANSLTAHSN